MKNIMFIIIAITGLICVLNESDAAQINFTPELILTEEYTDNLFLEPDDGLIEKDFITTVGINLTAEVLARTAGLEINYSPSYSFFDENDYLDYWRHYAGLRFWKNFTRNTNLELNSNYLESENPRDQSDDSVAEGSLEGPVIGVDPTRRDRNRYSRNANELRLRHQFGERNEVFGAVSYNILRDIDPPDRDDVDDHDELRPSFGLNTWFGPNWGIDIEAHYSDRAYEDVDRDDRKEYFGSFRLMRRFGRRLSGFVQYQHTLLDFDQEDENSDYEVMAPSVGIEYQLRNQSSLSIAAGYYFQNYDAGEDDDGTFIDAEINKRWSYRKGYTLVLFSSGYDIEDTGTEDLGFQIYYQGRFEAGYNFTPRFVGNFYVSYRYDDYPEQVPERSDQLLTSSVGVNYELLRWLNVRLSYTYDNFMSDIDTEEFVENSVMLSITISPSSPFRLN